MVHNGWLQLFFFICNITKVIKNTLLVEQVALLVQLLQQGVH